MLYNIKIPFCQVSYDEREIDAVVKVIRSGWWTTGEVTERFEKEFAKYVGAGYCVFVNSGTLALFLSLQWYKKNYFHVNDSEDVGVYVPSFTFTATVNEVVHSGFAPCFGDINKKSMCLEPEFISPQCKIAIPVHLAGNVAETKNYNIFVIEDSAHRIERNQCKDTNSLVCFSFYPTKNMTTGEGGAICTNNESAYGWFKQARHHGISKGGWNRYKKDGGDYYDIEFIGWKANASDITAALGLVQLSKLDTFNKRRLQIVEYYNREFCYNNSGLHLYPILVNNRNIFINKMKEAGIQCKIHFLPIHLMSAYKKYNSQKLPITEKLAENFISIPLYPNLKDNEVDYICKTIKQTNQLLPWLD